MKFTVRRWCRFDCWRPAVRGLQVPIAHFHDDPLHDNEYLLRIIMNKMPWPIHTVIILSMGWPHWSMILFWKNTVIIVHKLMRIFIKKNNSKTTLIFHQLWLEIQLLYTYNSYSLLVQVTMIQWTSRAYQIYPTHL